MTTPVSKTNNFEFNRPKANSEALTAPKGKSEKAFDYAAARAGVGEHLERRALARELGIPLSELEDF